MLRIIDKETYFFIRDDFTHDSETEIALDVQPAQGLYKPTWSGEITEDEDGNLSIGDGEWVEGATPEEIEELTKVEPQPPSETEMLHAQIQASNDYMDFLEEVIVEMAQMVYE